MSKTHNIKDFIGIFDGFISEETCVNLINLFEKEQEHQKKLIFSRRESEGELKSRKDDLSMILTRDCIGEKYQLLDDLLKPFSETLKIYLDETGYQEYAGIRELHLTTNKIQKTSPSQGYHVWHVEKDYNGICSRALVYTIYLNDILAGGETEFLFQKVRVSPKQGRVCIFPAQFPYVHRGNPPLNQVKYIVTSWLQAGHNPD